MGEPLYANPEWVEQGGKLVCGLCYEWAYRDIRAHGGVLVQGTVTEPLSRPPSKYLHAWVERGGKVYDWQTMVQGQGGKFRGKGFPKKIFYELFQPEATLRYNEEQAMIAMVRHRHYGPWGGLTANPTASSSPLLLGALAVAGVAGWLIFRPKVT